MIPRWSPGAGDPHAKAELETGRPEVRQGARMTLTEGELRG